ncbi:hypothetical protein SAMN05518672_1011179 [Chitinophaga sp. CF118]|uniref:hypothetical protein n=1 Tax=Chitinophaga sp. CF118 TaxID=1884367 RepID=UPI0008F3E55C|nr:hypothetical protein [Chitinophaga sp. CF118]SFD23474.1 hypothetical protein SAMN05518672_1011179 [Chitinophaga sp. CF118]
MFYFDTDKYDFWPVYNCITKYYPIGIAKSDDNQVFLAYPGQKALATITAEKIHDDVSYKTHWEDFSSNVQKQIQKPVIGTTYGQAPSFSAYVELERSSLDNLTRIKELHFLVSITGPFYTIIGRDRNEIKTWEKTYRSTNFLIVSPENEYADSFTLLCELIEEQFSGFRFVPFNICNLSIEGLNVHYTEKPINQVFNALFNNHLDLNNQILGNKYFKSGDWQREDYNLTTPPAVPEY